MKHAEHVRARTVNVQNGISIAAFRHDAMGNRVEKKVVKGDTITITRYLRDASGNVMSIYNDTTMIEQPIYGSATVGQYIGGSEGGKSILALRHYELSNHLGNVLSVVSDKVMMHEDTVAAKVLSTTDYYPFGLAMVGRTWSDTTASYRYGFNGKEKDAKTEWGDTSYDYGFRIYNPTIGKFLSLDPLTKSYPELTPYQFAGNTPIWAIDLDGLEPWDVNLHKPIGKFPLYAATHRNPDDPVVFGNDTEPWMDLINFKMRSNLINDRQISVQNIRNAWGPLVGMDLYQTKITQLPKGVSNGGELMEALRLNFDKFMNPKTDFKGYNDDERKKWDSNNPLGAVMSFDAWFTTPIGLQNFDDASVITSSYVNNSDGGFWTFSTVTTPGDGTHPIAGTRQFGVYSNTGADGAMTYTFYFRAADRVFDLLTHAFGPERTAFDSAEETWNHVIKSVSQWINGNGGKASAPDDPIHKRLPWSDVKK